MDPLLYGLDDNYLIKTYNFVLFPGLSSSIQPWNPGMLRAALDDSITLTLYLFFFS